MYARSTDSGVRQERLAFLGHVTKGCFLIFFEHKFPVYKSREK